VRMRSLVPEALEMAKAGDGMAFVSIVALRTTDVRLSLLPFIRFSYHQLNIRTYVVDPLTGQPAVYFIRSGVTSRFISLATNLFGIPWQTIDIEVIKNHDVKGSYYTVTGNWNGSFFLKAREAPDDAVIPAFFKSRSDAVDFLVRPLIGFIGESRRLGRFTIRHASIEPRSWRLEELSFPSFAELVVADDITEPHSVFSLPSAEFTINLPPKRVR
jgi:hypothetical protein